MNAIVSPEKKIEDRPPDAAAPVRGPRKGHRLVWVCLAGILLLLAIAFFRYGHGAMPGGNFLVSPSGAGDTPAILNVSVLVFREGLECVLVLAAITASMAKTERPYRRAVAVGAGIAFVATLATWHVAVRILDDLANSISALTIQAATGLLAILVLLLVMNWFFHKAYWTGWISFHNKRKRDLLQSESSEAGGAKLLWGMALLGFTSFYREGFEVVLFLQSYRLRLGGAVVLWGAVLGVAFSGIVAILTFVAHSRLPYRKMMVFTGLMLAVVLLVMVGEQAQEMQLAHWLPTTYLPRLANVIPPWMGVWLSIFPTVETLVAQLLAGILVFGSYLTAQSSHT
jgi:high-affinity iron transporter